MTRRIRVSTTSLAVVALGATGCGCGDDRGDPGSSDRHTGTPSAGADLVSARRVWHGDEAFDEAGWRIAVDDWSGDGLEEIVVSAPSTFIYGPDADVAHGGVYRLTGDSPSGQLEESAAGTLAGGRNGDTIGYFLAAPGDVTGDEDPDLLVFGVISEDPHVNAAIFAGPLEGISTTEAFTTRIVQNTAVEVVGTVARCGDLDGDDAADICTGSNNAPPTTPPGDAWTKVHIFRGPIASGDVQLAQAEVQLVGFTEEVGGFDLSGGHDLTGDGLPELFIGADDSQERRGGVYIVSDPPDGVSEVNSWPRWTGGAEGDQAGFAVASGGDLDGDGTVDLFVSAHMSAGRRGGAHVVTTPEGGSLDDASFTFAGTAEYDWFGFAGAFGDFDGDGVSDLAVGVPRDYYFGFDAPGRVALYLGPLAPGAMDEHDADRVIRGSDLPDAFGVSVAAADTDGDAVDELVVGASRDSTMGESAGAVYLLDPFQPE